MLAPDNGQCVRCGGKRVDEAATVRENMPAPPCPDCVPLEERLHEALKHTDRLIQNVDTRRLRRKAKA